MSVRTEAGIGPWHAPRELPRKFERFNPTWRPFVAVYLAVLIASTCAQTNFAVRQTNAGGGTLRAITNNGGYLWLLRQRIVPKTKQPMIFVDALDEQLPVSRSTGESSLSARVAELTAA